MKKTTTQQMRAWSGSTILTYGFRPFFFGASAWAALAIVLWVPMISGLLNLPTAFDPLSWHAHEFLYGYVSAIIAGFLLTAVPNWTGRLPIVGWRLGLLATFWLAGRVAVIISSGLPAAVVAIIDLSFPIILATVIVREIVVGKNWRNLAVLGMFAIFTIGNALFHWDAALGKSAAHGVGFRLGLSAVIMMIALIGGRIIPSFTRNWLVKHNPGQLPVPPMQNFDKVSLLVLLISLIFWVLAPYSKPTGWTLTFAGGLHLVRLVRWVGYRTFAEPLVTVLHLGYVFLPLGALALGVEILSSGLFGMAAAQHLWMGGAIGVMTLAVMTRATLGHTGQPLTAGPGTLTIYAALIVSVLVRVASGVWPDETVILPMVSGLLWLGAFLGFSVQYSHLLLQLPPAKAIN